MIRRQVPLLAALLFAAPAAAQVGTQVAPALEPRVAAAVEALRTHQDTSGVVGLSAAIAVDGEVVWADGFGYANLQHRVPMSARTVSRIGSISKSVAAVAAMALWDRGMLDLDAPVARYLPDYPASNAHITTRQLMSHTAGIRHYGAASEFASTDAYPDVFEPMRLFWADSLVIEPGSAFSYSTFGYTVVSAVTDAADPGRDWVAIVREEVVEPLGLERMQPEWVDSIIPDHAAFYDRRRDGTIVNTTWVDNSNKWAGGGLVATATDLVRFALGVASGGVLSDSARAEMWRRHTPEGGAPYGLGWGVSQIDGHRAVSHSGGSMGATAMLILLPDDGIAVAILGNTGGVGHGAIATHVIRLLLD